MSVFHNNALIGSGAGAAAAADFQIDRSLRFNTDDSSYLNRTPSSAGNRTVWTLSCWIKLNKLDTTHHILTSFASSTNDSLIKINGNNHLEIYNYPGSYNTHRITDAKFRDPSAWYSIIISQNGSTGINVWVNGVAQTFSTSIGPGSSDWLFNSTTAQQIGRYNTNVLSDYQLAEMHWVDGQALDKSDFGQYDDNNVWQPKQYSGTYGTNGFKLDFSDSSSNSALGNDSSGNSNSFTVNNLVVNVEGAETSAISSISGNTLTFTDSTNLNKFSAGDIIQEVSDAPRSGYSHSQVPTNPKNAVDGDINTHTAFSSQSGSSADWYSWTLPYARSYTTLQIVMSGSAASGNDVYIGASNGTQSQATNQFESSLSSTATAYTLTNMPNPVKSFSLFLAGGNYSPTFKLHGLIIDGSYVKTVTAASVSVANNQIVSEAGGDWATGRTAVKPAIEGDDMLDSPTNYDDGTNVGGNYCTLNPLASTDGTISDGNLKIVTNSSGYGVYTSTIGMSSGKWYAEAVATAMTYTHFGLIKSDVNYSSSTIVGNETDTAAYRSNDGVFRLGNSNKFTGATFAADDVIGLGFDADAGSCAVYKNGSLQGTATGFSSGTWFFAGSDNDGTTAATHVWNFGQRPFKYTNAGTNRPAATYLSLCTQNLPDPTIADGSTAFLAKTFTANASNQTITTGFSPDLVWVKSRANAYGNELYDIVRGPNLRLTANTTAADQNLANQLTSFNSDGFTLGNASSSNYTNNTASIAWAWDAGANSSKTFTVKVVSDSGNKYRFDDFGTSAVTLDLEEGSTYVFDQSDSSNSGHPLRFSTTSDGTHGSGSEYTTGVTTTGTPGSAGAKTTIVVAASAPTLYYYCTNHSGMGGQANTNSTAGASNFDGSIQSNVRASQTNGFSVFTYTGTGTAGTAGHGLNATPEFYILKSRSDSEQWAVYHKSTTALKKLVLNSTAGQADTNHFNDTEPTNSVLSIGSTGTVNVSGSTYVGFAWTSVSGLSSFGSYTGNGSSDGPFIYTGFRVRWLLRKQINSAQHWHIVDTARDPENVADSWLFPNLADAEGSGESDRNTDLLSNGFKIRSAYTYHNQSGSTYIYAAFAEHPFKTSRAR